MSSEGVPLLEVRHLSTAFRTDRGLLRAVDDVSFELRAGEILGIVGESGCGKTATARSILRLLPGQQTLYGPDSAVRFAGRDLMRLEERELRRIRGGRIAMVFQEPRTALDPVFSVGWQLDEALRYHSGLDAAGRRRRALEVLRRVGLSNPERRWGEYPHQLSGGMCQRVMIAMALACEPQVLIADEPTTGLDATLQAWVLHLLADLRRERGTAIVLITHDLGLVARVCDRVLVMYAGRVVEEASAKALFRSPRHPYTRALLDSIPAAGRRARGQRLTTIPGIVPSPWELPPGCRFHDRCAHVQERCSGEEPALAALEGRRVRCHFPIEPDQAHGAAGRGGGA